MTKTVYSVSELNKTVQQCLTSQFPTLWIEGEISNFVKAASGHMYMSLKDSKSQLRSAMFSGKNRLLRFTPANGQQVLVRGRIGLYEPRGEYQFIIEHMEEAGEGALQRAYEELKNKLESEGLFKEEHKKAIPSLATRIGIISSATGAAVQDAVRVIQTRFPQSSTIIYPCTVQGATADKTIIKALNKANQRKECDVLLLVRGGGSIEDLNAFNSEALARVIVDSDIPIISGVGHEIDFTIADFVADKRAPTPSVAAEYASPEQDSLQSALDYWYEQLTNEAEQALLACKQQYTQLSNRLKALSPAQQVQNQAQRLDDLEKHLSQAIQIRYNSATNRFSQLSYSFSRLSPESHIQKQKAVINDLKKQLFSKQTQAMSDKKHKYQRLCAVLDTVSPLATLQRGYSITHNKLGKVLQSTENIQINDEIKIKLAKGDLLAKVKAKS